MKWSERAFPRLLFAVLIGAAILGVGATLRLPAVRPVTEPGVQVGLQVTQPSRAIDSALQERLRLLDPTPLFLPSPLSSSSLQYREAEGDIAGGVLRDFPARLVVAGWRGADGGVAGGGQTVIGLTDSVGPGEVRLPFFGLARREAASDPLAARWAVAAVYVAKSGVLVGRVSLPAPISPDFPSTLWAPLELNIVVASDGLLGMPEMASSSGILEVDDYVVDTIQTVYSMGGGLSPGSYRLVVGP